MLGNYAIYIYQGDSSVGSLVDSVTVVDFRIVPLLDLVHDTDTAMVFSHSRIEELLELVRERASALAVVDPPPLLPNRESTQSIARRVGMGERAFMRRYPRLFTVEVYPSMEEYYISMMLHKKGNYEGVHGASGDLLPLSFVASEAARLAGEWSDFKEVPPEEGSFPSAG